MIDTNEIIQFLDKDFLEYSKNHEAHKERVLKAIDWWNENAEPSELAGFVMCAVNVNKVKCLCVKVDLRGAPFYQCSFYVRPVNGNEDAGSGVRNMHKISF